MNRRKSKNLLAFFSSVGLLSLLATSCSKSVGYGNTPAPSLSGIFFIQASPDQPALDMIISNNKINNTAINYGGSIGYFNVYSGAVPVFFQANGTAKQIFSDTINFVKNTKYSMFLVNTVSKPGVFLMTDTLVAPAPGKASLRFVNVSPDAPAADLVIKGGATLVPNKTYKGFSSFVPIAGNQTYTLEVHQTGTNTVLATLSNVTLSTGFLYTVWFHGLAAGISTTDGLAVDIINNAYFL